MTEHGSDCWHVEERNGWFFIVNAWKGQELAPVFDYRNTAEEICEKYEKKYPYFSDIPKVNYGTPYPRPNRIMPKPYPRHVVISKE